MASFVSSEMGIPGGLPPRATAAMSFVTQMNNKSYRAPGFDGGSGTVAELTDAEQAAYNAAVELLRNYFNGEVDLGDVPVTRLPPPEGGEPRERIPVTQ
jgi:hypothetical protein